VKKGTASYKSQVSAPGSDRTTTKKSSKKVKAKHLRKTGGIHASDKVSTTKLEKNRKHKS